MRGKLDPEEIGELEDRFEEARRPLEFLSTDGKQKNYFRSLPTLGTVRFLRVLVFRQVCFGMWGLVFGMWDWHACILFYSMVFTSNLFLCGFVLGCAG